VQQKNLPNLKSTFNLPCYAHISITTTVTVNTFLLKHGQVKQLTSISTSSPNTVYVTQHTNNCTVALFPHASKILLRIIQKQLKSYIGHEMAMEQAGLRKGCWARDHIGNVSDSWTVQESTTKNVNLFYRLHKGF
jgi:hypothetical protein